jgi:hypothetical protein
MKKRLLAALFFGLAFFAFYEAWQLAKADPELSGQLPPTSDVPYKPVIAGVVQALLMSRRKT